jgi:hypothetical protein
MSAKNLKKFKKKSKYLKNFQKSQKKLKISKNIKIPKN